MWFFVWPHARFDVKALVPGTSGTNGILNFAFASQTLLLKKAGRLMHLHRSELYFKKDAGSLMHWRRSCSAFLDTVFIRSSARPDCAGSRPLLAAAATTKRKRMVRRTLPIFPCLTLAQFKFGRPHSLPLLTGSGYLNLSSPKPGHTTGGSGRGARRGGGAASGRTGCQQNSSPR